MADTPETPNPCTLTLEDGTHYDLSKLSSAKKDYIAQTGNTTVEYRLNVCRGVVTELFNLPDADKVGGFARRDRGDFSIGSVSTNLTLTPATREPLLVLSAGSKCTSNENELASTAIRFICDQNTFGAGTPRLVAALPPGDSPCHFFFEWSTHEACAGNKPRELQGGHFAAFGILVFIAILTWFGGHTLYNRFKLGRRGMEQFPLPSCHMPAVRLPGRNSGESNSAPSGPRWGGWGRRSRRNGGYNHLRADEPHEEDGLAGRFSLEDDDDDDDDARALGGDTHAWRAPPAAMGASPRVSDDRQRPGVNQGLVDI